MDSTLKYEAKRTKDCSTCEAVPKLLRRDEPRLDGEVRKACFLRKQKCALCGAGHEVRRGNQRGNDILRAVQQP